MIMASPKLFGEFHTGGETSTSLDLPAVRRIGIHDLREALAKGFDDFWAMPSHLVFFALIYPALGLLLARLAVGYDVLPLIFPMVAGFALVGPVAATGLYALSARREMGLESTWKDAWGVLRTPAMPSIAALGLVLMALFVLWLYTAQSIYIWNFGYAQPTSPETFLQQVLSTDAGHALIVEGMLAGFLFAVLVLAIGIVSFPMMLDRNVGPVVAVLTSIRATLRNPVLVATWGLIVAVGLVIGSIPALIGLIVVMPVLGHATWHLYRRIVE
jgi:uncharacterized membrane protein